MIRSANDNGVLIHAQAIRESDTGIKVKIDEDVGWVPKSQVIARSQGELVVTSLFAKREGLV